VVEAAEHSVTTHLPGATDLARAMWRLELEREMRPRGVVVLDVLPEHSAQVTFAQRNDVIGALAA
jgi:hypothetical protein